MYEDELSPRALKELAETKRKGDPMAKSIRHPPPKIVLGPVTVHGAKERTPWSFTDFEEKIYQAVLKALGVEGEGTAKDAVSWAGHTAIAGLGTIALSKVFQHMTDTEAAAFTMALLFVYREVTEDDGMDNLDSIMDILGPALLAVTVGVIE